MTTTNGDHFFEPIDTPFGKIGLFVCYSSFPEVAVISVQGADIIIIANRMGSGPLKSPQFRTDLRERSNTVSVACDRVGANAMGESVVVDRWAL
ncbi:MAG: nitrilase-related carbon-nitrogen hydrolase [Clostridium sp.]